MKTFPMFLAMAGRRVILLGGGEQAAQKCRLMLKTEARITLAAPELEPELAALAAEGRIAHHPGAVDGALLSGAALVFVATGCRGADGALAALARVAGALVNVVDAPDLCDAFTPSIVDRDPVVVAIGTEGTAPVLARQIKTRIETLLEPRLGSLAALAGRMRAEAARRLGPADRRAFWAWAFGGVPRSAHARGAEREAARMLKAALAEGMPERRGFVSLVGAGPGSADLITLRGVQRLQEADVIFYDRLVDPKVLELARRDAERVHVGKAPGCAAWPQERISGLLVEAARAGRRVVRLKCGDPGIFARGAEEAAALDAAGIAWEIVPGVTAASAAAAAAGSFLTERGQTDTLVLTTGQLRPGEAAPDWGRLARPGTTIALYMAVAAAPSVRAALLEAGASPDTPVCVISRAGSPHMQVLEARLSDFPDRLISARVENPAIILVRLRKQAGAESGTLSQPREAA
jgi:uroporphyrin-III C-methyltransferase / precorrin-2 dehydrogenase / sirohydrochlorin ferrochelatase